MSPQAAMLPTPSSARRQATTRVTRPSPIDAGMPQTLSERHRTPPHRRHRHATYTDAANAAGPPKPSQQRGRDADAMTHAVPTTPTDAVATLSLHPYQRGASLSPSPHPRHPTAPMVLPHPDRPTTPACPWSSHTIAVATPPSGSRHDAVETPSPCCRHAIADTVVEAASPLSPHDLNAVATPL